MSQKVIVGGRIESKEVGGIVTGAAEILDDAKGKKQSVINGETDDELVRLDQSKQDNLTFDNAPTEGSDNPVKSGGIYAADKALSDAIEAILLLIPSAASALNKLVDTAMMNSSISTATATFRGTYNVVTDLELAVDATHEQIAAKLAQVVSEADNNDYTFVQVPVSAESTDIRRTERYKFNGTAWGYEYDLNTSGFTAAQWAAINSGITLALVGKLIGLPTSSEIQALLGQKQDILTFDNVPTAGSANPVKSGGVYSAINDEKTAREQLAQTVTGINGRVGNVEEVIPTGASANNKLVANNSMEAYVTSIIDAITASFTIATADGHINLTLTQTNGRVASLTLTSSDIASAQALTALTGRVSTAESNITSLGGRVSTNETDIANLQQLYNDLQESKPEPVTALPETGQQQGVIYRLAGTTSYSDYMWNGSSWVLMATYNNAIDPRPKKSSQNLVTSGGVFDNMGALDVSELNATENPHTLAQYTDLSAALAAVPTDYQKGGMSVKFVQSSDNKYMQFRLMSDSFNTTVANWQGVDDEPTEDSDNLVKSRGVANAEKYNNYKCSAIESAILGAKNIKAYNVNGWLSTNDNVINMTSSDSKTLILSVVPGDVIECTQSNGILIAFIKDFTLARTYPVVRSSEYPQSLQDPSYAVVPNDARYCFISYQYYNTPQRGIEYVKYNGTYLSYNGVNLRQLESDVEKIGNGDFDIIATFGDSRTKTTFNAVQQTALLCPISGNITNATIHVGESASAELRIYKSVDDTTLISTHTISLEAGVNDVTLDIPVTKGNMIFITGAKLTYKVYQGEDSNFYNYNSVGFVLRSDHVRFELSFIINNNIHLSEIDDDLEILKDGDFSSSESIGDSTTANTFNNTQQTGLLCTNSGVINTAKIHVGEAGVATIEVYKSINDITLLSTKTVSLEAGVNNLSKLKIEVSQGNIIYISGVKLTYRVPESLDSIFYSKGTTGFALRSDHVRFEVAYTIDVNVNVFQLEKDIESKADIVTTYPEQYITITPGNDNYNLIRNAIASITDASEVKHYTIIVPSGEYVECDLQGKKHVTIKGENRERVIIRNDGTSTKTTPSDYFWEDYANTPLNEIPRNYKHIIAPKNDIDIENCTLIANECKYVVHGENSGWYKAVFQNCKLDASNCNYTIGLGLRHIQKIEFINCHIVSEAGVLGIMYYHNWTWRQTTNIGLPLYSGGSSARFCGCLLEINGTGIIALDELASRNEDIALFDNCYIVHPENVIPVVTFGVNSSDGHSTAIDLNGNYYTDLEDVPYCMRLIAVKSGFAGMSIEKYNRPLAEDYVQIVD